MDILVGCIGAIFEGIFGVVVEGIFAIIGGSIAYANKWYTKLLIILMWVILAFGCCGLFVFAISS